MTENDKIPLLRYRKDLEVHDSKGCSGGICSARNSIHRFFPVLFFICFICFGSYFCYDNPAALQDTMLRDLDISVGSFMMLYSLYSWPNVILCYFGGVLTDSVFGVRLAAIVFSTIVLSAQILFSTGAFLDMFWLMCVARFIFGIGSESLCVAQNTYCVKWFRGKELNMVFGLQLSFARAGSTFNMNIMQHIYNFINDKMQFYGYKVLGLTLFFGAGMCLFSLLCAMLVGFFDKRADEVLPGRKNIEQRKIQLKDMKDFPLTFWIMNIICVAYYVAVFPFIGLGLLFFERKFQLSPGTAGAVNSVVYILSAFASPLFGFLIDKIGKNVFWLLLGIFMTLISHFLMAFTFLNPFIAMVMMGIGYSILACALWPMASYVVHNHQIGTAYGIMQSIQNLGLAVVAMLSGYLVDYKGYLLLEVFFIIWLCVALIAGIFLYLVDLTQGSHLNMSAGVRKRLHEAEENEGKRIAALVEDEQSKLVDQA